MPQKDVNQILESKEWKKDNVTLIVSKKNVDDDMQVGKKTKKNK